ncbi:MAG: hypothetical protein K9G76_09335 [Bacteroidales bacterium]|nr:hypothetical protein [Bacteroidales bacterium]MCF8403754.1 hypothetical protein [Bacteroidales bacterium]
MNINRNNYEIYFLDYHEKNLSTEQVAELMVFLQANPDMQEEFDSFGFVSMPQTKEKFILKDQLKKKNYSATNSIDNFNYEHWMVADIEGDLSIDQKQELTQFIALNPDSRLEYSLFKKTVLVSAEESYENKNELKKRGIVIFLYSPLLYAVSVAALVLIFLGVYFGSQDKGADNLRFSGRVGKFEMPALNSYKIDFISASEVPAIKPRDSHLIRPYAYSNNNVIAQKLEPLSPVKHQIIKENAFVANANQSEFPIYIFDRSTFVDEMELASNALPESKNRPSFAFRFISGISSKLFNSRPPANKSFLEYTISGYNIMADREVELEKEYDINGNIVAYNVKGDGVSYSRKVSPKNAQ